MLALAFVEITQAPESSRVVWRLIPPLLTMVFALVAWLIAPLLARLISGPKDAPVTIPGVTLVDLYAFAFLFLGVYFVLSSLGSALNWFHYFFLIAASHGDFDPARKASFYELSRHLITLIAGLLCIFYGRLWARKIVERDRDA
jgi:hypothetical protein